jgi:hypothetical protein
MNARLCSAHYLRSTVLPQRVICRSNWRHWPFLLKHESAVLFHWIRIFAPAQSLRRAAVLVAEEHARGSEVTQVRLRLAPVPLSATIGSDAVKRGSTIT